MVNCVFLSHGTVDLSHEGIDEHLVYRLCFVFIPPVSADVPLTVGGLNCHTKREE